MLLSNLPNLDRFAEVFQQTSVLTYFPDLPGNKEKFVCIIQRDYTNFEFYFGDVKLAFQFPNVGESGRFRFLIEGVEVKYRYLYISHPDTYRTIDEIIFEELTNFIKQDFELNPHLQRYMKEKKRDIL